VDFRSALRKKEVHLLSEVFTIEHNTASMIRKETPLLPCISSLGDENRFRILGIVDKLRELGVNENVSL
jgi:hypothetical protein